jgi:hypothetical protein
MRPVRTSIGAVALTLLAATTFCGKEQPEDKSQELERRLQQLRSVPYTTVSQKEASADTAGVTIFDVDRACPGYNLYCDRITPEAYLIDMNGNLVHRWYYDQDYLNLWSHALFLDNGDLIVLNKFLYIFQIDWNSNLKWQERRPVHHDVARADDGTLYVIERNTMDYRDLRVRFVEIAHLTPEGEEIDRWSTYQHLDDLKSVLDQASFFDNVLDSMLAEGVPLDSIRKEPGRLGAGRFGRNVHVYDYFHLNTISIVPDTPLGRRDTRFAAGNLLLCFRNVNQIAVLDWKRKKLTWGWGEGVLQWPHHPTMLPDGHILVFDNGTVREYSAVLELDPAEETVVWEYKADPPEAFYSWDMGSAQRLPNGNTLICESDDARVFEVTREGEIVWEWYNPKLSEGHRVRVYRMLRYPPEMVEPLLRTPGGRVAQE